MKVNISLNNSEENRDIFFPGNYVESPEAIVQVSRRVINGRFAGNCLKRKIPLPSSYNPFYVEEDFYNYTLDPERFYQFEGEIKRHDVIIEVKPENQKKTDIDNIVDEEEVENEV